MDPVPSSQASTLPYDPNSLSSTIPSSGPTDITSGSSPTIVLAEGNQEDEEAAPQHGDSTENDSDDNSNNNNNDDDGDRQSNTSSQESSANSTDQDGIESESPELALSSPTYKRFWSCQTGNVGVKEYEGPYNSRLLGQHKRFNTVDEDAGSQDSLCSDTTERYEYLIRNLPVKRGGSYQIQSTREAPTSYKKFKSDNVSSFSASSGGEKCFTTAYNQLVTLGYVVSSQGRDEMETIEIENLPTNEAVYPSTLKFTARTQKGGASWSVNALPDPIPLTKAGVQRDMERSPGSTTPSSGSISPESRRVREIRHFSREHGGSSQSPLRYHPYDSPSRRYHRSVTDSQYSLVSTCSDLEERVGSSEARRRSVSPPRGYRCRPIPPEEDENAYYSSSVKGESDGEDDAENDAESDAEDSVLNTMIPWSNDEQQATSNAEDQSSSASPHEDIQEEQEQQQPAMVPRPSQVQRQSQIEEEAQALPATTTSGSLISEQQQQNVEAQQLQDNLSQQYDSQQDTQTQQSQLSSQVEDEGQQPRRKQTAKRTRTKPVVEQPLRRSTRKQSSKPQSASDYKVCFSNAIDPSSCKGIVKYFDQAGRLALDKADCTIFVVPEEGKHTASSYCMQFSGKDVIDLAYAKEFAKPKKFIDYKARPAVNDLEAIKSMKERRIYFSRKFGFKAEHLDIIKKGPLGSCEIVKNPSSVDENTLVVIPDPRDDKDTKQDNDGDKGEDGESEEQDDKDEQEDDEQFDGCKIEFAKDFVDRLSCKDADTV